MNKPDNVYAIIINASPDNIWEALTKPDFTEQYWFAARVESAWTVGSDVKFMNADGSYTGGKLLEYDEPTKMTYEFMGSDEEPRDKPVVVTFELLPTGAATKLIITSRNLTDNDVSENRNTHVGLNNGWPAVASGLKTLLETGEQLKV